MDRTIVFLVFLIFTFAVTVLVMRKLIPYLRQKKMGQKILEIGPSWHMSKQGTPTMGGIGFIAATAVSVICGSVYLIFVQPSYDWKYALYRMLLCFGFALLCAGIGIIDDLAKFSHGKNEGLKAYQKYLLQLTVAVVFLIAARYLGFIRTELYIPFAGITLSVGWIYYPVTLLLLTGIVNAVNLTDGIDGLASSVTAVVMLFMTVASHRSGNVGIFVLASASAGGCFGFLVFNHHPAKVFMGDTGSLFLGGMLISMCVLIGNPLLSVIIGIVYITETASVILQVGYFKLSHGKRLFRMAPIHHHFEKCGWSEMKVVTVFTSVTVLFAVIGYFSL